MTRINCIPVTELTREHLLAEYRELPRVFRLARVCRVPAEYVLGKGHVTFFYNKLAWCQRRQAELVCEMKRRGYKPNFEADTLPRAAAELYGDWVPDDRAMSLNRARIRERLHA